MFLTIIMYGDCTSYNGQIRENVGFMECLSPYLCMVTVPHIMVRLERMLDYRGVGLARFHCIDNPKSVSKINQLQGILYI